MLVESLNRNDLSSVMIPIIREFNAMGKNVSVVVERNSAARISKKLLKYQLNASLVEHNSKEYYKKLLSAKYLINDSTFFRSFLRREGQIYINPWHGTPLKKMGYDIPNWYDTSNNVQRNMYQSSLFLQSCDYGKMVMEKAYFHDQIEVMGNPKMDILFDTSRRQTIRDELAISDSTHVILFAPTWRGTEFLSEDVEMDNALITKWLEKFEMDDTIIYFKSHQSISKHIRTDYNNVHAFPEEYDLNDFLNIVDCLVTDYSSIMFDFAVKNKPIVLYTPDLHKYVAERGVYMALSELPFQSVRTEFELLYELSLKKRVADYTEFNKEYNPLEFGQSTKRLFARIEQLDGAWHKKKLAKKSVLMYPGGLVVNGITTAFYGLLEQLKRYRTVDFYIYLPVGSRLEADVNEFLGLSDNIKIIASPNGIIRSRKEWQVHRKLIENKKLTGSEKRILQRDVDREKRRLFGDITFDYHINFSGYERYLNILFASGKNSSLFVHNDMEAEHILKRNINGHAMKYAYDLADHIVPISEELVELTNEKFYKSDKYMLCRNCFSTTRVNRMLEEVEFEFNDDYDEQVLNDKSIIKFTNIGRFSPEKSQVRLIEAFDRIKVNNPNIHLFLIGTPASDYEKILELTRYRKDISVYININPFVILQKSNLFVLSSRYEGLPMTFFEALALNVPILSTDMPSPTRFLNQGFGAICENSVDGLESGLNEFLKNGIQTTKVLDDYNEEVFEDFVKLINEGRQ